MPYGDPITDVAKAVQNPYWAWTPGPPTPSCPRHSSFMRYVAHHNTDKKVWWCDECEKDRKERYAEQDRRIQERMAAGGEVSQ